MSAQRHNESKPDLLLLLDHFPKAFLEVLRGREYGIAKYSSEATTVGGEGYDATNDWSKSINQEFHSKFKEGCRSAALRHLLSEQPRSDQDNVLHMAYVVLNGLMWLEYHLNEGIQDRGVLSEQVVPVENNQTMEEYVAMKMKQEPQSIAHKGKQVPNISRLRKY